MQIEINGAHAPRDGVQAKEAERADEQSGHREEHDVQHGIILFVERVRVRPVFGELGRRARMTFLTSHENICRRQMRSRIGSGQHVVESVTVITRSHGGRGIRFAQRHGFAVIRFAVMFQTVCVTLAATFVAGGFEIITCRIYDLMRAVAVNADRPALVAHREQLAVNALVVSFLNAHMTFATGLGDVGVVDGRIAIHRALDAVRTMTIVARWRDNQTHLQ